MNIGNKITILKESRGYKNFQDLGRDISISGDWLSELSRKPTIDKVEISRLLKICDFFNVSLDWLLKDNQEWVIPVKDGLPEDDIGIMFDKINVRLGESDCKFYGLKMNSSSVKFTKDVIDESKKLIKENI